MTNLTITVDENVLRRARIRALEQGVSLNGVLREFLEKWAGDDDAVAAIAEFVARGARQQSGSGAGGRSWARDELYER